MFKFIDSDYVKTDFRKIHWPKNILLILKDLEFQSKLAET